MLLVMIITMFIYVALLRFKIKQSNKAFIMYASKIIGWSILSVIIVLGILMRYMVIEVPAMWLWWRLILGLSLGLICVGVMYGWIKNATTID